MFYLPLYISIVILLMIAINVINNYSCETAIKS